MVTKTLFVTLFAKGGPCMLKIPFILLYLLRPMHAQDSLHITLFAILSSTLRDKCREEYRHSRALGPTRELGPL
jgi:hypothetical protein